MDNYEQFSKMNVIESIATRRSLYELDHKIKITPKQFRDFIALAQTNAPSPVNSQSTRIIVLTDAAHQKHWDEVEKILANIIPSEKFAPTATKLAKFRAAYATILLFEDGNVVNDLQNKYQLYATKYPDWAHQANAMLQYALWVGFESMGLGVSIQHYNPLIDEMVQQNWGAPATWQLITEMVVGNPLVPAKEKMILPLTERLQFIDTIE